MAILGDYICTICDEPYAPIDTDWRTGAVLLAEHVAAKHPKPTDLGGRA